MKKSMLLLVASFWVVGNVFAIDVAFDFKSIQATSGTTGGLSWSTGKTGNASNTACNATNGLVLYGVSGGGGYFNTTSPTSSSITQIVVVSTAKKNTPKYTIYGSSDGSTWTSIESGITAGTKTITLSGNYTYIKIANTTSATAQLAITSITITYGSGETTYSVTFDAGENGTCGTTSLTETSQGSGVTLPSCTPNTGYTFVGWATSSSATSADVGEAGALYKPTSNCTLYAVYSAIQYTVTWVVGSNSSKTQSYNTQVAHGSKATPPAELTLMGNEIGDCVDSFVGWSKSTLKSPTNTPPSDLFKDVSPDAITENTIFYAVFATKQTN